MNDDFRDIESNLAQLQPAALSFEQRQRLRRQIGDRLNEKPRPQPFAHAFHWRFWLTWCSGTATVAMIVLVLTSPDQPTPRGGGIFQQIASSNSCEIQVRFLDSQSPSSSLVNRFFNSVSSSNFPQAILPAMDRERKI